MWDLGCGIGGDLLALAQRRPAIAYEVDPVCARFAAANAAAPANAQAEADACVAAKQQLLNANTDADFDRAERRMRLICGD